MWYSDTTTTTVDLATRWFASSLERFNRQLRGFVSDRIGKTEKSKNRTSIGSHMMFGQSLIRLGYLSCTQFASAIFYHCLPVPAKRFTIPLTVRGHAASVQQLVCAKPFVASRSNQETRLVKSGSSSSFTVSLRLPNSLSRITLRR